MVGAEANANNGTFFGVTSLAFSPDGQTLASGGGNATVRLWRISDGTLLHTLEGNLDDNIIGGDYETHLAFSPDGQILAISAGHGRVRLWYKP